MSQFARDVVEKLQRASAAKRLVDVTETEVDDLLRAKGVSTTSTVPTPQSLQLTKVRFGGSRRPPLPATNTGPTPTPAGSPFEFDWNPGPGLNGLGSARNLRGKSTVLEVILWALRGTCGVQEDVAKYIDYVDVGFAISGAPIGVEFTVTNDQPVGKVVGGTSPVVQLASFETKSEFAAAMAEVMMPRLQLPTIPTFSSVSGAYEHAWPSYAGALAITVAGLDILIGDHKFGLPARLLQMFIGTPWATTKAQAQTARKSLDAEIAADDERAGIADASRTSHRAAAQASLDAALAALAASPDPLADLAAAEAAVANVQRLSNLIAAAVIQHADLRTRTVAMEAEKTEEQRRQHQLLEDALAVKFFNRHQPTMCPRCTSPVTNDQRKEEAAGHACSVCHEELDLDAFDADLLIASTADETTRRSAIAGAKLVADTSPGSGTDRDAPDDPVDTLTALETAIGKARAQIAAIETNLGRWRDEREQSLALATPANLNASSRRDAELAVARAQGALEALTVPSPAVATGSEHVETMRRHARILTAADDLAGERVTEGQRAALTSIADRVTVLARSFGMDALTKVEITGSPSLKAYKSGVPVNYSRITRGEQLRLKVALAVALLHTADDTGIGRHPGLLLVDSPAAEELAQENVDAMVRALADAVDAVADSQVIIATRNVDLLNDLLDDRHRRIADGDGYLW
ncbi:hypothetical protein [Rhodococcus wratislaviensis]|uniref:Rad50/SbcC-type AAA domain-containing protein n=1 Tax=Rhodococcus wratislaviensis NBRC 100605 TaxID=1219028 RepID=X0QE35_RHOWR|nr:hypothetical protein [Rhodococcus wratislaviensis]GAF49161.1 hypothetical protein RW1_069_00300 [Rhodococcus wratislaviensis NBRC 100605]